ncbi:MAG: RDD family protein [Phycisphaerae bacterium]
MKAGQSPIAKLVRLLGGLLILAGAAAAEPYELRIASGDNTLWIAFVGRSETRLFRRTGSGDFGAELHVSRRIQRLTALDDDAIAIFDDRSMRRYWSDRVESPEYADASTPELLLSTRYSLLDLIGVDGTLFGLVRTEATEGLTVWSASGPTSKPFTSDAPLSLVHYRGSGWTAIAGLPSQVRYESGGTAPRLCATSREVFVFWRASPPGIECARYDLVDGAWSQVERVETGEVERLWPTVLSRVPTLVALRAANPDAPRLVALRRLPDASQRGEIWRAGELKLSDLPAGVGEVQYLDAQAHAQDLVLLCKSADERAFVRFARIAASPGSATLAPAEILGAAERATVAQSSLQLVTLLLLFGVLTVLFVFRRDSMLNAVVLPQTCEMAFAFQRVAGFLIDFAPFTVAAAALLRVDWQSAISTLAGWGLTNTQGAFPPTDVIAWWGLSAGGFTAYSLVLELLLGRTIGKLVVRTRVRSERCEPPRSWQIVVRNLVRLIELMPQFWILGFLVLISRNRQRLGDVFARTIVVRAVNRAPQADRENPSRGTDRADDADNDRSA